MSLDELKQQFQQFLLEDHPYDALMSLQGALEPGTAKFQTFLSLSIQYRTWERSKISGALNHHDAQTAYNDYLNRLLGFMETLTPEDLLTGNLNKEEEIAQLEAENKLLRDQIEYLQDALANSYYAGATILEDMENLEGRWLEIFDSEEGGKPQLALGQFKWRQRKSIYEYNGQNYDAQGNVTSTWKTIRLLPDLNSDRLYYIYRASPAERSFERTLGFGILNTQEVGEELLLEDGYFFGAGSEQELRPFTCYRLDLVLQILERDFSWEVDPQLFEPGTFIPAFQKIYHANPGVFPILYQQLIEQEFED